nr:13644_t:CDS:2 [Entrophospora candida]
MANNITLNCIVILNNPDNQLSANNVSLKIIISRNETVDNLQTAIQNQLESNIPLDIRQICQPGPDINMSRKSRNNRRKTQGEHIIIINRNTQDTKAVFDYEELIFSRKIGDH